MSEGQEGYGTVFVSAGAGHRDSEVKVNDHWSVCFGEAGHLSWDKDGRELRFEGNADAAAMYFFDRLIQYSNEYIARMERVCSVAEDLATAYQRYAELRETQR